MSNLRLACTKKLSQTNTSLVFPISLELAPIIKQAPALNTNIPLNCKDSSGTYTQTFWFKSFSEEEQEKVFVSLLPDPATADSPQEMYTGKPITRQPWIYLGDCHEPYAKGSLFARRQRKRY